MPWVPEEERKTVWYLTEPRFLVRVPQQAQRNVEDIKYFGTPTTGNDIMDHELAKNLNVVMLPISEMEDIFHRGYDVRVVNYDDTKRIYEYVNNHLVAFKNLFTSSENISPDPQLLDDLIRLDRFAAAVYEPAKFLMKHGDFFQSFLAKKFKTSSFSSMSRQSILSKHRKEQANPVEASAGGRTYGTNLPAEVPFITPPEEEDNGLPARVGLTEMFEHQKRMADRMWKGN